MSNSPEMLDPEKREVLDRSPYLRFFLSFPEQGELVENPQSTSAVQELGKGLVAHLGIDWQEHYLPLVREFADSFEALSHESPRDQQEDWIMSLLLLGFELGRDVDLFVKDIQTKMDELNLLVLVVHSMQSHDAKRGHDFVGAVLRIGARFRSYPLIQGVQEPQTEPAVQSPTDWRGYPFSETP